MQVDNVKALVSEIKARLDKVAEKEGAVILSIIELADLYGKLRKSVRDSQWEKRLAELGQHPRVVSRYLSIGRSWWGSNVARVSTFLPQMPIDVHKLEWLAKLSPEELPYCVKLIDCKHSSRGAVIQAVQRMIGERPAASEDRHTSVKDLKKRWSDYIRRMVSAIDNLGDRDVDGKVRQDLWDEMQAKFAEVEKILNPEEAKGVGQLVGAMDPKQVVDPPAPLDAEEHQVANLPVPFKADAVFDIVDKHEGDDEYEEDDSQNDDEDAE